MLNKLKLHHSKKYQPLPRVGHHTVVVGDRLYLWGGWSKAIPKQHSNAEKIAALSNVDIFNLRLGNWDQIPTSGNPPLGVAYYACAYVGEDLYYFGGRCGHGGCHHNTIHRLSTVTMKWKDATPSFSQSEEGPMKKAQCGMMHFKWKNDDLLLIIGGYGLLPVRHQLQATYIPKRGNLEYGWTNEAHIFNIKQGLWTVPDVTGEPPPPCSNFSMVSLGDNRGAMFGGFQPEAARMSDVFIAELTNTTVFWTKLRPEVNPSVPQPKGSCDHSMTYISGYHSNIHSPCLLIQGGENDEGETLSDCWIMELHTAAWKHITLPSILARRMYHSLSSVTIGPYCIWLILFGGVNETEDNKDWQEQVMLANTAVVEIVKRPGDNDWMPSAIYEVSNPTRNSVEEYMKKLNDRVFQGRKDWVSLTGKNVSLLPAGEESARANRAELRADSAEQQAAESRKKAEETENVISNVKLTALKERRESVSLYSDLSETRKRAQNAIQELRKVKEDLLKADGKIINLEDEITTARQKYSDLQEESREEMMKLKAELHSTSATSADSGCGSSIVMETPDWLLSLDEVKITDDIILSTRSGNIYTGDYCGIDVAVKVLKKKCVEDDFITMVTQINKLRHPNLVLFLGAVNGENPSIVYESLPSKPLNLLLEEAPLSRSHMLKIAKDICQAVRYLHQQTPLPITHGTINSRVIFVETLTTSIKAKLSDVCLYPLYSQPQATYMPPESYQSPKMDVYAFGVLLIEMYCRKALNSSQSEREKQVQHINWPGMVDIIKNCLLVKQDDRFSMKIIFTRLIDIS